MALGLLWAVLAGVASNMVLGMLWYGPLFGKQWLAAMGKADISEEEKKEMQKSAGPGYATSMIGAALAVVVIWFLYDWSSAGDPYDAAWLHGLVIGFSGWLAFYAPGTITGRFFEGTPWSLWAISGGYWLVLSMLYGVYVGIFA